MNKQMVNKQLNKQKRQKNDKLDGTPDHDDVKESSERAASITHYAREREDD